MPKPSVTKDVCLLCSNITCASQVIVPADKTLILKDATNASNIS